MTRKKIVTTSLILGLAYLSVYTSITMAQIYVAMPKAVNGSAFTWIEEKPEGFTKDTFNATDYNWITNTDENGSTVYRSGETYTWIEEAPASCTIPNASSDSYTTNGTLAHLQMDKWTPVGYNQALRVDLKSTTPSNQYMRVGRNPVGTQKIYYSQIKEGQCYTHRGTDYARPVYQNQYYEGNLSYTGEVTWYWN